ncbi:MAG: three-Cys-motif partner protein TcmP [Polyangiaceae bacterium]
MANESTLWPLGEHTPGKHLVLEGYLKAWYPILGMTQDRIVFIDGFAGPGEYERGEPGSPLIALRTLKEHAAKARFSAEIKFLFVEDREDRVRHLEKLVELEKVELPPSCSAAVVHGRFDATMTTLLDDLEAQMKRLAPCFLMVDPFGVSDTPMGIIQRIMRHPKSEVYVSFMYESINRWKATPEFEPHLDALFGCPDWRRGLEIADADEKKAFFFSLYRNQLKQSGAEQVLHFELYRGNRLIYAIFFGTKHLLGCDRMKQAIWKVAPSGDYAFRGTRTSQLDFDLAADNAAGFARELKAAFDDGEWHSVEEALAFSQSDLTDYHSGHLKKALVHLEKSEALEVDGSTRKRARTFPDGTRFRFIRGAT